MLFTVTNLENSKNHIVVSGCTQTGNLKGIWNADSISPVTGKSYQIELDFGIVERAAVHILKNVSAHSEIIGDSVRFTAMCESIDEIYFLRFSFDGLEMLELRNDDFTIQINDFLSFSLPFQQVGIYPY